MDSTDWSLWFFWLLVVAFAFGLVSAWIASVKRRSGGEGLVLGCLFGPFGALIEALLPTEPEPAPAAPVEPTRKCPECAETIKAEAHVCRFCGARFSEDEVAAAVARASEPLPLTEIESNDPRLCRFCGRDSRANWQSARERICRDCVRRPEVQDRLRRY